MAENLPDLITRLRMDVSDMQAGVGRVSAIGAAIGGAIGATVGPAIAGAIGAVRDFVGGSVDAFAELEDSTAAAGVIFGDSMATIIEQSKTAASTLGLSSQQVINAANTFGTYGKSAGLAGDELAGFSTDMTTLAGDLASFKGTTTEQAIEAIGSALRGEAEPIRAYGVLLDDATLKARALAMGIADGTSALTPQQKVLAAQAEILAQTSDAQGDFARTMFSTANVAKTFGAETENLQAKLGTTLAPAFTAVRAAGTFMVRGLSAALDEVIPRIQGFYDRMAEVWNGVRDLLLTGDFNTAIRDALNVEEDSPIIGFLLSLREGFTAAGGGFQGMLAAAQAGIGSVVDWLSTGGLQSILDTITASRERLFDAAMALFPGILEAAMATLPAVVAWVGGTMLPQLITVVAGVVPMIASTLTTLVPIIVTTLTTMLPVLLGAAVTLFGTLVTAVTGVLPTLLGALAGLLPVIVSAVIGLVPTLLAAAVQLFSTLVAAVTGVLPGLLGSLLGMLPPLITTLLGMVPTLLTTAMTLFLSLVTAVAQALPQILTAVVGMLPGLVSSLLAMVPTLLTAAVGLFTALVTAVTTILPELITTLVGTVLPNLLTTVLGMLPQLLTTAIVLFTGIVTAVTKALPKIVTAVIGMLPVLIGTLLGMVPQLIAAGVTLFVALVPAIARALPQIIGALLGMGASMVREVSRIDLAQAGRDILDGFLRGLKAGFEQVKDFVGGIGSWIADHKGPKAYDLALLRPAGGWIMDGLERGIADSLPSLGRTLARVADTVAGTTLPAPSVGDAVYGARANGASSAGAGNTTTMVRVFIGDRELTDIVRTETVTVLEDEAAAIGMGSTR